MIKKCIVYIISVVMMLVSFYLPPTGQIDPSVILSVGVMLFGYELLFGNGIKSFDITKEGIHFEKYTKNDE